MEKTVLTKEEVENLTSLQTEQNDLMFQLGTVEYQLGFLGRQKNMINNQIEAFESKQAKSAQELETKYGKGSVNLESGEFIKA